jgi:hypothetical protein
MTDARAPRHLVDVWNPSYASDAMTAHLTVLLEAALRWSSRETEVEPYVWWGKVRSPNRQQGLKHLPQIVELASELAADERECHLYLTDYRSLYVGDVAEIRQDDVRGADPGHVPGYYTETHLECDFWYKLLDIRRLVADDTPVVIARLKALHNTGYNDRPVSLYGGMVDLPLVVYRDEEETFFDPEDRGPIRDDRLWAEIDAEAVGVGKVERQLREDLFGDDAWLALDPGARTFIASAEKILREQREDPAFDYGPVVSNLAKAVEVTCNAILRRVGPRIPRELRQVRIEADTVEVGASRHLTIGQLAHILRVKTPLHRQLRKSLENGDWFVDQFPQVLSDVASLRNPGVHRARIGRESVVRLRNRLVGVGCQGALVELSKVRPGR